MGEPTNAEDGHSHPATPPSPPENDGLSRSEYDEFFERVVRYLNNNMSDQSLDDFNTELQSDSRKQEIFVRACLTDAAISEELSTQYEIFRNSLTSSPEEPTARREPAVVTKEIPAARRWSRPYHWAAAAMLLITATLGTVLTVSRLRFVPPRPPFATVTSSYRALWQEGPDTTGFVPAGRELSLSSGWVEVTYGTGTRVTFIGPAIFTLDSPTQLSLRSGRLSTTVAGKNFVLLTPDARIADLGTEFGASVLDRTEFAVFTGKIEASSRRDTAGTQHRILTQGDAAGIASDRVVDDIQSDWPQLFPRRLPVDTQSVRLSDLLSGGDGTMARQGAALDTGSGTWTFDGMALTPHSTVGDHAFHQVPTLRVLNGSFIPDGPTTIDTEGHIFAFPKTTNISYNQLRVGGIIPWLRDDPRRMRTALGETEYARSPHHLVEFHSNKGVTFDLEELRSMHPGTRFESLRAMLGNSFPKHLGGETAVSKTGIYILVDGQPRFQNPQFSNQEPAVALDVPLQPNDRFLTIAVTDGGDGLDGDWVLLGDPQIIVSPSGATQ